MGEEAKENQNSGRLVAESTRGVLKNVDRGDQDPIQDVEPTRRRGYLCSSPRSPVGPLKPFTPLISIIK
jgi:hypothetical protein